MEQSTPGEEDRQAITDINRVFVEFDKIDAGFGTYPILPTSELASDAAQIPDWPVSSLAPDLLGGAIDHMHSLRLSAGQPPEGHAEWSARAPWTLMRSALESASQSIWMMCENDQDVRLERCLRVWYDDRRNFFKAENQTYRRRHRDKLNSLQEWDDNEFKVKAARWDTAEAKGRIRQEPSFSECIAEAAEFAGAVSADMAVVFWRVASGYAHGRPWSWQVSGKFRTVEKAEGLVTSQGAIAFEPIARMIGITVLTIQYADWLIKERSGHQSELLPFMTIQVVPPTKIETKYMYFNTSLTDSTSALLDSQADVN